MRLAALGTALHWKCQNKGSRVLVKWQLIAAAEIKLTIAFAMSFCTTTDSVVTIVSEPASIDYDRSFEINRDVNVDSMLHGHVDWQFHDQCQLMYCMLWFDTQRVETVKLSVCDTLRQAPNIRNESYTTNDVH